MMKIDATITTILRRAQKGIAPSKEECQTLLNCTATSLEAAMIRSVADAVNRQRFGNEAIILGQIGIEIDKCPGQCKFCSFGEEHSNFTAKAMSVDEILAAAKLFTQSGDLYALFLMTMHTFEFERLLDVVRRLRAIMPESPQLVVNIGDFDLKQANELKNAGVNGAYHVCRLREGKDTALDPEQRKLTIRTIKDAGLDWYTCCEPIGPEHSSEELVEQLFLGVEYGCFQHAAMRRVYIPGAPLAERGQITELRLAQITAVVTLASLGCPDTKNIAVHEPNLIGLTSGANVVYAEAGANPRDTEEDTTGHRGRDIQACKTMLYEAGFDHLLIAPGKRRALTEAFKH
jgi:biotin synthase